MTGRRTGAIRQQLVIWFAAVGLLPLLLVAAISYWQTATSLERAARQALENTATDKKSFIRNWFDYRWMDLALQASNPDNLAFLKRMQDALNQSPYTASEFIHTDAWAQQAPTRRAELRNIVQSYDYIYDVFLIDPEGTILFTVAEESDLGSNLITGFLKDTRFSQAMRHALVQRRPVFSDYEHYAPSAGLLSGFLVAPMITPQGELEGLFAIQIKLDRINTLLAEDADQNVHHYLVGSDDLLRSPMPGNHSQILRTRVAHPELQHWAIKLATHPAVHDANTGDHFMDASDEQTFRVQHPIQIGNVTWLMVSEIDRAAALHTATRLGQLDLLLLLFSGLAVVVGAHTLSRYLSKPIAQLNDAVERFTHTNVPAPVTLNSNNELGSLAQNVNRMMAAREEYEHTLKGREIELDAALAELRAQQSALSHHAIVAITDIKGTIQYVNRKFEEISGYRADELVGQNHRLLNSGYHPQSFFRDMYLCISKGNVWHGEICNRSKSGQLYWVATTIAPLHDSAQKIDRYIAMRTDITEQKAVQNQLRQAKDTAEEAAKAKSAFLATMSHEIRTPMNGVLGMLGLLMRTPLNADQQHQAKLAMSSAESLLVLINDILDFSKIEAGRLDIETIDFDLATMLGDFAESMAPKTHEKGVELILDMVGLEHNMVKGDPGRLRQIISNLVSNAIKFTQSGEIVLTAALRTTGDYQYRFECAVKDTGIGIPPAQLDNIFGSFTQVDASTTRQYGGTGLGLAIVKQLCTLMGGDVAVHSQPDEGSTFQFHITLQPSQMAKAVVPAADLRNVPILVVDDNATNREVLSRQLALWGSQVDLASNADDALTLLAKRTDAAQPPYAVAFLDKLMPGMDGTELGKAIRTHRAYDDTKLIMMTSIGNRGDARRLAEIGFNGYFPKPTTLGDLINALAVLIDDGDALAQATPLVTQHYLKSLSIEPTAEPATEQWPAHCRLLLVEDNPINQSVVQGMLDAFHLTCETANNGEEALALLRDSDPQYPYTLILMDCQMPVMDGYETTRHIRKGSAGEAYRNLIIVAMTANAMSGDREKCLDAGMHDYMSKPLNQQELHNKLRVWINGDAPLHTPAATEPAPTNLALWDQDAALKRVRGKPERLNTLITMYLEGAPDLLRQVCQSMGEEDYAAATHAAHTLKGVAANLSLERLAERANQVEQKLRKEELDGLMDTVEQLLQEQQFAMEHLKRYLNA